MTASHRRVSAYLSFCLHRKMDDPSTSCQWKYSQCCRVMRGPSSFTLMPVTSQDFRTCLDWISERILTFAVVLKLLTFNGKCFQEGIFFLFGYQQSWKEIKKDSDEEWHVTKVPSWSQTMNAAVYMTCANPPWLHSQYTNIDKCNTLKFETAIGWHMSCPLWISWQNSAYFKWPH